MIPYRILVIGIHFESIFQVMHDYRMNEFNCHANDRTNVKLNLLEFNESTV